MKNINKIAAFGMGVAMLLGASASAFAQSPTSTQVGNGVIAQKNIAERAQAVQTKLADALSRISKIMDRLQTINQKLVTAGVDVSQFQAAKDAVMAKHDVAVAKVEAFKSALSAYKAGDSVTDLRAKASDAKSALHDFISSMKALHLQMRTVYQAWKTAHPRSAPTVGTPVSNPLQ